MKRWVGVLGLAAPVVAALIVAWAGTVTPGYDPATRTISRLAERGLPAAGQVDLALYLVAIALLGLAVVTRPRMWISIAGVSMLFVATIHLDPTSAATTGAHRLASAIAMLALTRASFDQRVSTMFGWILVALLLPTPVLLIAGFADWGLWERCFAVVAMGSLMVMAATAMLSSEETMRAPAATTSATGT